MPGETPAMSLSNDEEKVVRSYLLGELGPQDTQALEERLLGEEAFVEQLLLLEHELIEDYTRGALSPGERARFESHFLSTPKRRRKLMLINGIRRYADDRGTQAGARTREQASWAASFAYLFTPRWRAVALAVLLVAAGIGAWSLFFRRSEVDRGMLALNDAYRRERPLEARITGLSYAPFVNSRGNAPGEVDYRARDLSIDLLLDAASKEQSATALHAAGRLYMAQKEFDKAISQLQAALRLSPDDAGLHSDMGAALLELGRQEEQSGDAGKALESYAQSLEHLSKASQLDPNLLEPLYNRALVMERQMLPAQAEEAWRLYLQHDAQSKWAEEARRHLKLLSERSAMAPTPQQLMQDFLAARRARDDERAWQIMSRNREMISGKFLPQRIAVAYLKDGAEGNQREQDEMLLALAYAGRLELERARDPYVSDLAAYYARSSVDRRRTLGQAQTNVSEGYDLCLGAKFKESLERFLRAKELFESVGDELESRLCEYWVGYCYSQLDELGRSTDMLRALAEYCRKNHYSWLLCQTTCWIATNYAEMGEHSRAIESYNRALAIARDIDDDYIRQKALSQLASQYNQLGQPQRALDYNWQSLQLANSAYTSVRQLWRDYLYTTRTLINLGLYDAAAAFGGEMLRLARDEIKEADVLHYSYQYLGSIYAGLKQYDEAFRLTSQSLNIARSLDGAAARKQSTYSLLQLAHLQRQAGRCEQALDSYDQAIQVYDQMELGAYKYDARKGRLLCYVSLRRDSDIEAELPVVLEQFRQYRSKIAEEQNRNTFFDREQSIYDIAIDYAYTKGEVGRAFDYSEASRARSLLGTLQKEVPDGKSSVERGPATPSEPLGLSEIQGRIPEAVQVIQYAVLEDKTLIWLVTKDSVRSAKSDIPAAELHAKILTFINGISTPPANSREDLQERAKELYDLLVGPVAGLLDPQKVVCIIPDKAISLLPFSALVSPRSGRYLIKDFSLLSSPSLNVFLHCSDVSRRKAGAADETLLSVGNPAFDSADYPGLDYLPAAAEEAKGIATYYGAAYKLIGPEAVREEIERELPKADVIHFAGHYILNDSDPLSSKLVLAKRRWGAEAEDDGSYTARQLVGLKLPLAKLVVLSACQTGVGKYYNGEGVTSIARVFLETGIPLVVASQWSVDSAAASEMMLKFHRYRKTEGLSTVAALRRAQVEMLSDPDGTYRDPYYWAAFLPLGGHAEF